MKEIEGKVALVTGASSGIGRATAEMMLERGARTFITARRRDRLDELSERFGNNCVVVPGDLTDRDFRRKLIGAVEDDAGGLDMLVNSAGILVGGSAETTTLEEFDRTMDINVRVILELTQLAIPLLRKRKGSVTNLSSVTGPRAFPGVLAYCVSKAAVDQMTRCMALELGSDGIRVNAVNPGVIRTELHRAGGMSDSDYARFLERGKETHPLGRVGEAREVAELIVFLASERASFITGECVAVDGGRAQTCMR